MITTKYSFLTVTNANQELKDNSNWVITLVFILNYTGYITFLYLKRVGPLRVTQYRLHVLGNK